MAEETKLNCKNLLQFLQDLSPSALLSLYDHSAACLAVLRELPELARLYAMRTLFLEHPLPLSVVESWYRSDSGSLSQSVHQTTVSKLQSLRVWESISLPANQVGVKLNDSFKKNLRTLMCGGGTPWALHGHTKDAKHVRDVEFLSSYADRQWEAILNFMVEPGSCVHDVATETVEVLQEAGLVGSPQPLITSAGFQFLLLDRPSQVWYFMLRYLSGVESKGISLVECLHFLFQLSFMTLGKDYSTQGLSPSQLTFLQHLRHFGLVYQRKGKSKRYYPTALAVNLVSGLSTAVTTTTSDAESSCGSVSQSGYIVLETNYRVVAYTSSRLQIATLSLFCQLQYRFPNMVVGTITRESVHEALVNGITSEQILTFLRLHAHPNMLGGRTPVIPPTISDQVRLWERERDRLVFSEGVLYSGFQTAGDFETVRKYAEDLSVLLWSHVGKRLMVVSNSGHDEVRRFWRRQKQ